MNLGVRMTNGRYYASNDRVQEAHRDAPLRIAMTFFAYNLIKKHGSLKGKTPAMAAGITDHAFTVRDMLFAAQQQQLRVA